MVTIINLESCDGCGSCVDNCPVEVLAVSNGKVAVVDSSMCTDCGCCVIACPHNVLQS